MKKYDLNDIENCSILSNQYIKSDFDEFIKNFDIVDMDLCVDKCSCTLKDEDDNYIILSKSGNSIRAMKYTKSSNEMISIENNLITQISLSKRKNGVIFSVIKKEFAPSKKFNDETVLVDLSEERYTLSKDKLDSLLKIDDFDSLSPSAIFTKIKMIYDDDRLKADSDHYSFFSTKMNNDSSRGIVNRRLRRKLYPTTTYLNDTDISRIYDIDGSDMLYRVFDLYKGIINSRCENDIFNISLGFLSGYSYDLFEVSGIKNQEDSLIGIADDENLFEYHEYLKKLFEDLFAYVGEFSLDRESILNIIGYKMRSSDVAKRIIAQKIGMPYEEFEKLDLEEQQKIIEKVNVKKMECDRRFHIDGIPMDGDHIITLEDIDKRITEVTSTDGTLNKIFKKIKDKFKRR